MQWDHLWLQLQRRVRRLQRKSQRWLRSRSEQLGNLRRMQRDMLGCDFTLLHRVGCTSMCVRLLRSDTHAMQLELHQYPDRHQQLWLVRKRLRHASEWIGDLRSGSLLIHLR